jgi:hypothetical protein
VAWVVFIGLCIEAGALIVNFGFSLYDPEFVHKLYQKIDISAVYERSRWVFFSIYGFVLVISILKALLFYIVIRLVTHIDLSKPFSSFVSRQVSLISYYTLCIGLLSLLARQVPRNLENQGYEIGQLNQFWLDGEAFILMSMVVFIIATIFRKGIEIQNENELTV